MILPNFPKTCMKLKEFGWGALAPPLDPPLEVLNYSDVPYQLSYRIYYRHRTRNMYFPRWLRDLGSHLVKMIDVGHGLFYRIIFIL